MGKQTVTMTIEDADDGGLNVDIDFPGGIGDATPAVIFGTALQNIGLGIAGTAAENRQVYVDTPFGVLGVDGIPEEELKANLTGEEYRGLSFTLPAKVKAGHVFGGLI